MRSLPLLPGLLLSALLLCGPFLHAQSDPAVPASDELGRRYAALLESLRTAAEEPAGKRERLLQEFLRQYQDSRRHEVVMARLKLASLHLQEFELDTARAEFAAVAGLVAGKQPAVHAWALYGLHQAQRLAGDLDGARGTLTELIAAHAGTARAEAARVALAQLDRQRELLVGQPLPSLRLGVDIHGRDLRTAAPEGPRLLVFFSLAHEPSRQRLEELAAAWERSHRPAASLIAFALEDDAVGLRRLCDQHQWSFPILPGQRGFLQPDWVELGVTAVPTVFLVGKDGTLMARDLSPDRLSALLDGGN